MFGVQSHVFEVKWGMKKSNFREENEMKLNSECFFYLLCRISPYTNKQKAQAMLTSTFPDTPCTMKSKNTPYRSGLHVLISIKKKKAFYKTQWTVMHEKQVG